MVDVLVGRRLVTREGAAVEAEVALQNKVVALYFAAGRCASSREFTPLLRDFYTALAGEARRPAPFEVVFVSADGSAQEMLDFVRELHGAWLALPFQDPYRQFVIDLDAGKQRETLVEMFRGSLVMGASQGPNLNVIDEGNQITVCQEGRDLAMIIRTEISLAALSSSVNPCTLMGSSAEGELKKRYNITATPRLVIVKQNGEVITNKGRKQIRDQGLACFQNWLEVSDVFQNFSG